MLILASASLLGLYVHASSAATVFQPANAAFKAPVKTAPGFAAHVLFSNLTLPRGIAFDDAANLLVVERGLGITAFTEVRDRGGWERSVVIQNPNFTQGIQLDGNHLYASTASETLRFVYDPQTKTVNGTPQVVVNGLPADGELTTHTLQLERTAHGTNLLIASGPLTNIDPTARDPASGRSQIRRFSLRSQETQSYLSGDVLSYGIRNPGGFAFSPSSPSTTLFVVENGASIDNVTGLTATFVNDNPADELEKVDLSKPPVSFGFPDCTTLWNPVADPVGVPQYANLSRGAQISLHLDPGRDDAWCARAANNKPPALSFQAHSVPLDIKFYTPRAVHAPAFPDTFSGDAFVSFRGSFDRTPPTGYGIVRVPFKQGSPTSQKYTFLIQAAELSTCPGACIRPVGLAFGKDGRLYASSDSSGELFVVERI